MSKDRPIAALSSIFLENPSRGRAASVVLSDTKPAAPADAVFFNKGWATAAGFRLPARSGATSQPRPTASTHEIQLFRLLKHVAPNTAKAH